MKNNSTSSISLREQKRIQLRKKIQEEALSLFLKQGYNNTTVEQIAKATNVSHMSIFRYFPTKEDIVLDDGSESLIVSLINKQSPNKTASERIETAVLEALKKIYPQEKTRIFTRMQLIFNTPDLRAKMWDKQITTAKVISGALSDYQKQSFQLYVISAVYVTAMTIGVEEWLKSEGKKDLLKIIKDSFQVL